jgi:multidrug efflux pump subunit AcrA (membrane-fusion protein)
VRAGRDAQSLLDELVSRLQGIAEARSVLLLASEFGQIRKLALSGIAISGADDLPTDEDHQLSASRSWTNETRLKLVLSFDEPVSLATRQPLTELCEALLDLAGTVYMQSRIASLERVLRSRADQDKWIGKLYEGLGVRDSFAAIVAAVAPRIAADRVSLMRSRSNQVQWVAASNQATVDRRASQVRLLELAVKEIVDSSSKFSVNSKIDKNVAPSLQTYFDNSGCREIHIEVVPESDAVIVLERFQPIPDAESLAIQLDPIRTPVESAIANASQREHADWAQIARGLSDAAKQSNAVYVAAGLFLTLLASIVIQVPLMIPVDGTVTAVEASRIYAPAEGIVDEVLVDDGDHVRQGAPLVRLRSPQLDLQQRALEGTMLTARSRLDSLQIARTGRRLGEENETNLSADEKVLKSEIDGLEKQLELIQTQQAALLVRSPVDGRVDGWDLRTTLTARPVAVGQLLLTVISESAGWKVQLDVPDRSVGYLLEQQAIEDCAVRFRLRSDATVVHNGAIDSIADSARLDPQGKSIVRATLPFDAEGDAPVREGSTVLAHVNCGNHPVGFVWLRGLIEWWRTWSWF